MRPTTAQIETFFWVARLGSVKEAAQHLKLAQPTISLRLQELEGQFKQPLFDRSSRRMIVTASGEALLARASSIVADMRGIRDLINGKSSVEGVIRIGVSETFAQICLSECIKYLSKSFPNLELDIVVGTSFALEKMVLNRDLDLAFVINPIGDSKLAIIQLGIQEACWSSSPNLKFKKIITPSQLTHVPIILTPHPSPMYQQVMSWFRQAGVEPSRIRRCTSVTLAVELVRAGIGVGFLPNRLIQTYVKVGSLVKLSTKEHPIPSRLFAIYRFAEHGPLIEIVLKAAYKIITELNFLKQ